MLRWSVAIPLIVAVTAAHGASPGPEVAPFVVISSSRFALRHINVIDGSGSTSRPDQTILIADGRVVAMGPASATSIPEGVDVRDYPGHSVLPGLVGMHDHLFYSASNALQRGSGPVLEPGNILAEIAFTAPRLYQRGSQRE